MSRRHPVLLALLLACLVFSAAGCGKKAWPTPREAKHRFTLSEVHGALAGSCLAITARVGGSIADLDSVTVAIAYLDSPTACPDCPFLADAEKIYSLSDPALSLEDPRLSLTHCGLDAGRGLRFRLSATNIMGQLPPVRSEVLQLNR